MDVVRRSIACGQAWGMVFVLIVIVVTAVVDGKSWDRAFEVCAWEFARQILETRCWLLMDPWRRRSLPHCLYSESLPFFGAGKTWKVSLVESAFTSIVGKWTVLSSYSEVRP